LVQSTAFSYIENSRTHTIMKPQRSLLCHMPCNLFILNFVLSCNNIHCITRKLRNFIIICENIPITIYTTLCALIVYCLSLLNTHQFLRNSHASADLIWHLVVFNIHLIHLTRYWHPNLETVNI